MAQAAQTRTTRRSMLRGAIAVVPAAALASFPALSAASDPMFAAVDNWRAAREVFLAALAADLAVDAYHIEPSTAYMDGADAYNAQQLAMVQTAPATLPGLVYAVSTVLDISEDDGELILADNDGWIFLEVIEKFLCGLAGRPCPERVVFNDDEDEV